MQCLFRGAGTFAMDFSASTARSVEDLEGLLAAADEVESSGKEDVDAVTEEELKGPPTDDFARRLFIQDARAQRVVKRLKQQKKCLQVALKAFKKKEREFVLEMDTHMDEVEGTEQ